MKREISLEDWEQVLCEQIDRVAAEPDELMRYELIEQIMDDMEDLLKMAYIKGRTFASRNGEDE